MLALPFHFSLNPVNALPMIHVRRVKKNTKYTKYPCESEPVCNDLKMEMIMLHIFTSSFEKEKEDLVCSRPDGRMADMVGATGPRPDALVEGDIVGVGGVVVGFNFSCL